MALSGTGICGIAANDRAAGSPAGRGVVARYDHDEKTQREEPPETSQLLPHRPSVAATNDHRIQPRREVAHG